MSQNDSIKRRVFAEVGTTNDMVVTALKGKSNYIDGSDRQDLEALI